MTTPEEGRYLEKPRKGELSHLFDFEHDGMGSNEVGVARGSLVYKWFTNWHRRGSIENFLHFYIFTFLHFYKCSGFILPTKQFPQSFAIFVLPSRVQGTIWYAPTCNFGPVRNPIVIEQENLILYTL